MTLMAWWLQITLYSVGNYSVQLLFCFFCSVPRHFCFFSYSPLFFSLIFLFYFYSSFLRVLVPFFPFCISSFVFSFVLYLHVFLCCFFLFFFLESTCSFFLSVPRNYVVILVTHCLQINVYFAAKLLSLTSPPALSLPLLCRVLVSFPSQ